MWFVDRGLGAGLVVLRIVFACLRRISSFVALGLDASEHGPLAGLAVTTEGFRRIGGAIARLGLPTVFVQEGGYLSEILGANLTAVLAGFEEVR